MRRLLVFLLVCALTATGICPGLAEGASSEPSFTDMSEPAAQRYVQDMLTAQLEEAFGSDDYAIQSITTAYLSQEYIDELDFNSQENVYFGYRLSDLKATFGDTPYVFTLGEDGTTITKAFENYDDTFEQVIRNVAIGGGVIIGCAVISVAAGAMGAATVSMIFAMSAKGALTVGLSEGIEAAVIHGLTTAIRTGDPEAALRAAALEGSEDFKFGAIAGALAGTVEGIAKMLSEPAATAGITSAGTWRDAEIRAGEYYGSQYGDVLEQVSYKGGEEVAWATEGATRPDLVYELGDHLEAVEVKQYALDNRDCVSKLLQELKRQISQRMFDLPEGSTQRICLDVTGRDYTAELLQNVVEYLQNGLSEIYPDIPVDVIGLAA